MNIKAVWFFGSEWKIAEIAFFETSLPQIGATNLYKIQWLVKINRPGAKVAPVKDFKMPYSGLLNQDLWMRIRCPWEVPEIQSQKGS